MKMQRIIFYILTLVYGIVCLSSCNAECIEDPTISTYVKDLYIENADQSKTYYLRLIRRNVNGVWIVSIGAANSIAEDKPDGSNQVLAFSLGKNIENEKVLTLTPLNGFSGFGYISLDWEKIPAGKEILCKAKINSNGYRLRRGGEIDQYLKQRVGTFSKSSHHDRFTRYEKIKATNRLSSKSNADYIIKVSNQKDFDNISGAIASALKKSKKNIQVNIESGQYHFNESHVYLKNLNEPNAAITIKGSGNTILIGSNNLFVKAISSFNVNHVYLTSDLKNKDLWSGVKQMRDTIEIVDVKSKLCRLKSADPIHDQSHPKCKLKVTEWFKVLVYDVLKFENGYIYFYAPELSYTSWLKCYNVNQDFGFGKKYPRYRLFYEEYHNAEPLIDCNSSCFVKVEDSHLKSFSIEEINFKGSACYAQGNPALVSIKNLSSGDFCVSNCNFSAIGGKVVDVENSHNVTLENNHVRDCYIDCFASDNKSTGFVVKGNKFENNGLGMNNSACVIARGKKFLVSDNVFCDFSYTAISVGMNFQWKKDAECSGIVENNEIHYSSEYFNHPEKYCLMDGGAIYVMTQLDDVVLRYNRIYDYTGHGNNRGIFCDDGTKNVSLYGNIITNIPNSLTIDLRLCTSVANRVADHNSNIMMMYNIVDGKYRFQGVDKNSASLGSNFILSRGDIVKLSNDIVNVSASEEDYYVDGYSNFGTKSISLQVNSKEFLKQSPIYTYINKYLK